MKTPDTDPLILTLALDLEAQARFDALRRAHFPPALNHIAAHVTMFHHLPGDAVEAITAALAEAAAAMPPFDVAVAGLRLLGRGVAYDLAAPPLTALRRRLAHTWVDVLTPQDRQGWRPHVTIQNKVNPADARALRDTLSANFEPYTVRATGLHLWWYRGGPWDLASRFDFNAVG